MQNIKSEIIKCDKCLGLGVDYKSERRDNLKYAYNYKPKEVESPPYVSNESSPQYIFKFQEYMSLKIYR